MLLPMVISWSLACCTSNNPTYPDAALRVYSEGSEITSTRLFKVPYTVCDPSGSRVEATPKMKMVLTGPDIDYSVEWVSSYKPRCDQYDFTINCNNVVSKRRILYRGKPIVLTEEPFIIVVDGLNPIESKKQKPRHDNPS